MGLSILALLLCLDAAVAATLSIGDKKIEFQEPSGFVTVEGNPGLEAVLAGTKRMMPPDQEVLAMYVAASALKRFEREGVLERYMLITTSRQLKNKKLRPADAKEMKKALKKGFEMFEDPAVLGKLNDMFSDASDGAVELKGMEMLGWYAETDMGVSLVALLTAGNTGLDDSETVRLAMVSTNFITDGKFVTINQYKAVSSFGDVEAFKDEAQAVIAGMAFPAGSSFSMLDLFGGGSVWSSMLVGGIGGGLVAVIGSWLRKRRSAARRNG